MNNSKNQPPRSNVNFNANKHRPENKDNLDHREGEEQNFKGDDMTHNRKERKSEKPNDGNKGKKRR